MWGVKRGGTLGLPLAVSVVLAACGGHYGGVVPGLNSPDGGAGDEAELFAAVQPRLEFCRTCHIPNGIGDVDNGRDFMLGDPADDYENLRGSWVWLGGNNPVSRILTMASGAEVPHSGGAPWPEGSESYELMEALLRCFGGEGDCSASGGANSGADPEARARLGSPHGGPL